ncbi:ABC transporter permease [Chloroflexota bacterium]
MGTYIIRRLIQVIPTILGVFTILFILAYLMPGDPVRAMLGENYQRMDEETIQGVREEMGLERPFLVQYVDFLWRSIRLDLGQSYILDEAVNDIIGYRLPRTIQLMLAGMMVALVIGLPAGIISAVKQYTWIDHTLMFVAVLGVSMPVFWQAILAKMFLTQDKYGVALFPVGGYGDGNLWYLVLPALVLGTHLSATIARVTRSSMLEVRSKDYINTARAKGLSARRVLVNHQLRNALIPIITVIALDIGYLLGGSVVTETVFSWPGLGRAAVTAINRRDTPVIMGILVFGAILFVFINLITDLIYAMVDPRIRYD